MNTDNLIKFCEALESGQFPQDPAGGYLKTTEGYCCLGVLEEVRGVGFQLTPDRATEGVYSSNDGDKTGLPAREAVTEFLGLPNYLDTLQPSYIPKTDVASIKVTLPSEGEVGVHTLNDRGYTFRQIAALIRKEYNLPSA